MSKTKCTLMICTANDCPIGKCEHKISHEPIIIDKVNYCDRHCNMITHNICRPVKMNTKWDSSE